MRFTPTIATLLLLAPAAHADPSALDLFHEGRELMKAGDLPAACERFARSNTLDQKVGTLLNLGDCRERNGERVRAWQAFSAAATLASADGDPRQEEARKRAGLLERRLAFVTVAVVESPPANLVIRRNGTPIESSLWNVEVPLEPDTFELTAEAPGYERWSVTQSLPAGRTRLVVTMAPSASASAVFPAVPKLHTYGLGVVAGANTSEHALIGVDGLANLDVPFGTLRGVGSLIYSRYTDVVALGGTNGDGPGTVNTVYANVGIDWLWTPAPQLSLGAGLGVGIELDSEPTLNDVAGAFQVRGSPIILHLQEGRIEAGIHVQLAFASSEIKLHVLAGLTWMFL